VYASARGNATFRLGSLPVLAKSWGI
jgi:hypothetical protein